MVSGRDDRLRRLRSQPGQTLRARASHRTKELLLRYSTSLLTTHTRIVPGSQYHGDNYEAAELSVLRHKESVRAGGGASDSPRRSDRRAQDGGGDEDVL